MIPSFMQHGVLQHVCCSVCVAVCVLQRHKREMIPSFMQHGVLQHVCCSVCVAVCVLQRHKREMIPSLMQHGPFICDMNLSYMQRDSLKCVTHCNVWNVPATRWAHCNAWMCDSLKRLKSLDMIMYWCDASVWCIGVMHRDREARTYDVLVCACFRMIDMCQMIMHVCDRERVW